MRIIIEILILCIILSGCSLGLRTETTENKFGAQMLTVINNGTASITDKDGCLVLIGNGTNIHIGNNVVNLKVGDTLEFPDRHSNHVFTLKTVGSISANLRYRTYSNLSSLGNKLITIDTGEISLKFK